ncbi:uncharacterized protein LOC118563830 [Fundulus heteroclitus]|uniref:uncharacterized protein LOC118563830 n=1 Tax=Fundulus heteroclitus TaxID=8078 RepID=UPI00165BF145|nr:uncharacterized protein LOC118563830 [Fundulus heteroclitus]
MSQQRKEVVWNIKKNLFRLSSAHLYEVARDLVSGNEIDQLSPADEEGCLDYVIAYMQSEDLLGSEDEGLSTLLMLNDVICKILDTESPAAATPHAVLSASPKPSPSVHTLTPPNPHSNPPNNATTQPGEELRRMYEELGKKLRLLEAAAASPAPTHNHHGGTVSTPPPQTTPERMIPLKDLPFLQRREFKVHGGQIGDQSSEISYNSISKQIDEGLKDGFPETEVVRGVLRIIKPGTFKDMLSNKDELAVPELKVFLRSHLGEKATTEMFQELMCARQAEQESPQQFLYRMIGLKQRLFFQSKQADTDISYDPKTIQGVFLNTIYQGLGAKHADLRQRLRPLVSNSQVTDEEILGQMTKMISDENEHQRRLSQPPRQKNTQAHTAKVETGGGQTDNKLRHTIIADDKNHQTIQQLSAQVETLTQMVAALMDAKVNNSNTQMAHSLPQTQPYHPFQPTPVASLSYHHQPDHLPITHPSPLSK